MPTSDGSETILVVEDELMVRQLIVRQLERLGYTCLEASDGLGGVETVKEAMDRGQQVNLVITDLIMPRMNGRELADKLEHLQPGVPILFMSGYTDDEMMRRGLLAPGAEFIQKPFDTGLFATKLRTLLKHASSGGVRGDPRDGGRVGREIRITAPSACSLKIAVVSGRSPPINLSAEHICPWTACRNYSRMS